MPSKVKGKVIEVTDVGDLVTDISESQIAAAPRNESVRILVDGEHETFGIFEEDHRQPAMTLICILASGALRLHLVGDSATMMLGVRKGADVEVRW
jgi:S-adenosylmethionine hydrolase